eukprot:CAMPEP_0202709004 /NCGR_PEP_ID=MMETSP1385-20130828/21145_1 /ASSEMBLY_ACC=CAM_ASM_000861 /TAXON_ID=933848 /ORGANISM="Elphidium margaritaceum" /LENGTH=301 /DNA_ID=CAMNT_0049368141 /DNA_START=91 /DNA_END=996 /DNA_ORIENTATION=+
MTLSTVLFHVVAVSLAMARRNHRQSSNLFKLSAADEWSANEAYGNEIDGYGYDAYEAFQIDDADELDVELDAMLHDMFMAGYQQGLDSAPHHDRDLFYALSAAKKAPANKGKKVPANKGKTSAAASVQPAGYQAPDLSQPFFHWMHTGVDFERAIDKQKLYHTFANGACQATKGAKKRKGKEMSARDLALEYPCPQKTATFLFQMGRKNDYKPASGVVKDRKLIKITLKHGAKELFKQATPIYWSEISRGQGEASFPDGYILKTNELGMAGIGSRLLKTMNERGHLEIAEATKAEYGKATS